MNTENLEGATGGWQILMIHDQSTPPEVILAACTRVLDADGPRVLGAEQRERWLEIAREMAGQALRVLAVARKERATLADAEREMTLASAANPGSSAVKRLQDSLLALRRQ